MRSLSKLSDSFWHATENYTLDVMYLQQVLQVICFQVCETFAINHPVNT